MKNRHPADIAASSAIQAAVAFNVHLRISPTNIVDKLFDTATRSSAEALRLARAYAAELECTKWSNRRPVVYAITADNRTWHVPADHIQKRAPG